MMLLDEIQFLLENKKEIMQEININPYKTRVFMKQIENTITSSLQNQLIEHFNLTFESSAIIIETYQPLLTDFYNLENYNE